MSGKIYIASNGVITTPVGAIGHLYLVYDPNSDLDGDEEVIRGGPSLFLPPWGAIEIELGVDIDSSEDEFDGDTPSERNFTTLDLNSLDASVVWAVTKSYAETLSDAEFDYDLNVGFMANSNSVVTSVLSLLGLDLSLVGPIEGGNGSNEAAILIIG